MNTRAAASLAVLALLFLTDAPSALWSKLSSQMVVFVGSVIGLEAQADRAVLQLGAITLDWSEDCSGLRGLVVLIGVALWLGQHRGQAIVSRLLLVFPLALLCNTLRVLAIAGFRALLSPGWEGERLHFALGFLCLTPAVLWLTRPERGRWDWLGGLHVASVLAATSAVVSGPGGPLASLCAITLLLTKGRDSSGRSTIALLLLWAVAGGAIAGARMESLWIPWLLACPGISDPRRFLHPIQVLLWFGTVPLLGLFSWAIWLVGAALVYAWLELLVRKGTDTSIIPPAFAAARPWRALVAAGLALPFVPTQILAELPAPIAPPPALMSQAIADDAYRVRLLGQAPDLVAVWYGDRKDGRHHSIRSCLDGATVRSVPADSSMLVMERNGLWITEFFVHKQSLWSRYADYLHSSFEPWSDPGIHLVLYARRTSMEIPYFLSEAKSTAAKLQAAHINRWKRRGLRAEAVNDSRGRL